MSRPWAEAPPPPPSSRRRWPVEVIVLVVAATVAVLLVASGRVEASPLVVGGGVVLGIGALASVASPRFRAAFTRVARRFGELVGHAVGAVCFTVLALFVVVVPWAYQRVVRLDPLGAPRGWEPRRRRSLRAPSPWAADERLVQASFGVRLRRNLAPLVVVAAIVLAIPATREIVTRPFQPEPPARKAFRLGGTTPQGPIGAGNAELPKLRDPVPPGVKAYEHKPGQPFAAHKGDAWFDDVRYAPAQGWAFDPRVAWRPMNPNRFLDWTSTYVNVVGGHRLSWEPPACGRCKRLTVWVYGGSTTFGLDQRDEGTISSWLAKTAYDHGITIDVVNRGEPGHVHWEEAELFANDLLHDPPPDLVIFYDGVNDAAAGYAYSEIGLFNMATPIDPTTVDVWKSTKRGDPPVPDGPPGSAVVPPRTTPNPDPVKIARYTMRAYDRARKISKALAKDHGIPVVYAWQPSRYTRPLVMSEPHFDTKAENQTRLQQQILNDRLAKDVIDLTDVLDDNTDPLFTDDVHHNEEGARLIAEALYARIEPKLERLLAEKE